MQDQAGRADIPVSVKNRQWLKPAVFVVVAAALFMAWLVLPVKDSLQVALQWMQSLGWIGLLALGVGYAVACVALVPGSVLTLGAGFLAAAIWPDNAILALVIGTAVVSIASTTGASLSFLLGRTLARDWIAEKIRNNTKFFAIDQAVGESGLKIVLLFRLSPIFPFNLLNYGLGLTKVAFRHYLLASWVGMLPGTVMYVYFGSAAQSLTALAADKRETPSAQQLVFFVGLAATIAVVVLVTRIAGKTLKRKIATDNGQIGRNCSDG